MKTLYTLLLLCTVTTVFAQKQQFPDIPYNWYRGQISPYYKLLRIRDKSAIIITTGELPDYHHLGFKYAVFLRDGSVRMFTENDVDTFTEIAVSEGQLAMLKNFLLETDWLEIGKYNLNGKPGETIIFLDGTTKYISIRQGDKELELSSRNTLSNIELKVPGWEDRVKLLELISNFNNFI